MDFAVLGWEGVAFRLDHRRFAYAGKFVVPGGKAVVLEPGASIPPLPDPRESHARGILAAVAFSADRTDPSALWIRYVTVRTDRRGEGVGPRLLAVVADRAASEGYEQARIAVNNPFAYEAAYKAGFAYTGTTTGIAELVCRRPTGDLARSELDDHGRDRSTEKYRSGIARYRERDLSPAEERFCERARERGTPPVVDSPA
jgi:GNAT superfamily N-acetyltransferase